MSGSLPKILVILLSTAKVLVLKVLEPKVQFDTFQKSLFIKPKTYRLSNKANTLEYLDDVRSILLRLIQCIIIEHNSILKLYLNT